MGTRFGLVLYAPDSGTAHEAAEAAFARIAYLDRSFSDYQVASEVNSLSATAGDAKWTAVSDDLWRVLVLSQEWSARTQGAFDVTVGPLTRLWRWAGRRATYPSEERIARARSAVDHRLLLLNAVDQTVRLGATDMHLDLGGIGKGYAADAAMEVLRRFGITRALVDAGGDLVVGDAPPERDGWQIEIPWVDEHGTLSSAVRTLVHCAVATSGDTYRSVRIAGERYSHLVDPRSGWPIGTRRIVTVRARSGADADALASALSILGVAGVSLLRESPAMWGQVLEQDMRDEDRWQRSTGSPAALEGTMPTAGSHNGRRDHGS